MIEKLIDILQSLAERLGISKDYSLIFAVVLMAAMWGLFIGAKHLLTRWKNQQAAKNLYPQFDYQAIRQATLIYIPTQYQNASPARQDEPGFTHQYVSRSPLIPFFIKTAFNEKADGERFYLILADSGMGKTTFMLNLYLRYHSVFNRHRKHRMRLFRFSHPDTLQEIKAMSKEEAKNTILLLDALDEDPNIVSKDPDTSDAQAFQHRVDEIIEATRNFREVVMTCRTQYFPGQENDPYELKVKRSDEKGFYTLNKLYLSPFTDAEVRRYLNKKYGYLAFWNQKKKKRAAEVVQQSRHLVMRPMMLSYIDYLVEDDRPYNSLFDTYEALIEKWLVREAEKRKFLADREAFIGNLRKLSEQTATVIWKAWKLEQRMYLTKEEAIALAQKVKIDLKPEEVTGQSLLTCDGAGNWKFAHKSVWEFFLAKRALRDFEYFDAVDEPGMDMAGRFFEEKLPENFVAVKGGGFVMGSNTDSDVKPRQVFLNNFCIGKYLVTQAEYQAITGKNPARYIVKGEKPVDSVSWLDAIHFCNLLNKKHGYPPAYNDKGHLLDAEGNITTDLTRGRGFRLPTEAEFEYAVRGGSRSQGYEFIGSNTIEEAAWFGGNLNKRTHLVSLLELDKYNYNLHESTLEWCYDWYDERYYGACKEKGTVKNPLGPENGSYRVVRGRWIGAERFPAYRDGYAPDDRHGLLGFRLALSLQSGD
jgi:formylglycine-generating enzyme required for sulfatase activity